LVALAIIAVLIALLVPAVQKVRQAAAMAQSLNNIKQISLSLHHFAGTKNGHLPGWYEGAAVGPLIEVLPYLEQQAMYHEMTKEWSAFDYGSKGRVACFINPLDASIDSVGPELAALRGIGMHQEKMALSSYAVNAQFFWSYPRMNAITDGTSNTIWLTEHYGGNCNGTAFVYNICISTRWKAEQPATFAHGGSIPGRPFPGDYYPRTTGNPPVSRADDGRTFQVAPSFLDCDPRLPNASSTRGLQIGLADGSVRILSPKVSAEVFWGMVTHDRSEVLPTE
jgi:hypothetical protein